MRKYFHNHRENIYLHQYIENYLVKVLFLLYTEGILHAVIIKILK
jgi:hypothetical protein